MLAKLAYKSSSNALIESARLNFDATENECALMKSWLSGKDMFGIVNDIRKRQNPAGGRNMFAAIAETVQMASETLEENIENQRFCTILFAAAAFEAGMIDANLTVNVPKVHASLFPNNSDDFPVAFPQFC